MKEKGASNSILNLYHYTMFYFQIYICYQTLRSLSCVRFFLVYHDTNIITASTHKETTQLATTNSVAEFLHPSLSLFSLSLFASFRSFFRQKITNNDLSTLKIQSVNPPPFPRTLNLPCASVHSLFFFFIRFFRSFVFGG